MSSDDAYSSFLDQANQDTGTTSSKAGGIKTKAVNTEVPASLKHVKAEYTSESDEPFEPVSLEWKGKNMPSENEFGKLIAHDGHISTIEAKDFDPRAEYASVIQAVEQAGDGKALIYKVQHGKTRVEYYVLGHDTEGKKVVGLKALAVET